MVCVWQENVAYFVKSTEFPVSINWELSMSQDRAVSLFADATSKMDISTV